MSSFDFPNMRATQFGPYWTLPQSSPSGSFVFGPLNHIRGMIALDVNGDSRNDIFMLPSFVNIADAVDPVAFINNGDNTWTEQVFHIASVLQQDINSIFSFNWNGGTYLFAADQGWEIGSAAAGDFHGAKNILLKWDSATNGLIDETSLLPNNNVSFNHVSWAGHIGSNAAFDILVPALGGPSLAAQGLRWFEFGAGSAVLDLTANLPTVLQYSSHRTSDNFAKGGLIQQAIGNAAAADVDGDGLADLITVGYDQDLNGEFATLQIFRGTGLQAFSNSPIIIQAPAIVQSTAGFQGGSLILTADIERTGHLDLVVLWEGKGKSYLQVLHNDGALNFTDVTDRLFPAGALMRNSGTIVDNAGNSVSVGVINSATVQDVNGDGLPDLVLETAGPSASSASDNTQNFIYLNVSGTYFMPFQFSNLDSAAISSLSQKSAINVSELGLPIVADVTGDGRLDLVTVTPKLSPPLVTNGLSFPQSYSLTVTPGVQTSASTGFIGGSNTSDTIVSGGTADTILGLEGNDQIYAADGSDLIIDGPFGTIPTTAQNDTIAAGNGNSTIWGGAGSGSITVGNGNNLMALHFPGLTSYGNTTVHLGNGNDTVFAVGGDDTVFGGGGLDLIAGGTGKMSIVGGSGLTVMSGGTDASTLTGGSGPTEIISTSGKDSITGGTGGDTILAAGGSGTTAGDIVRLGASDDALIMGTGSETVFANLGSGKVVFLVGGFSAANQQKTITLGTGADTFVFSDSVTASLAATETISITGYKSGTDHFTLQGLAEHSLSALQIQSAGSDTRITVPDVGTILLVGIAAAKIGTADFSFT